MAYWGDWVFSGGNGMRVGYDVAGDAPPNPATATYHAHYWFYVQTQYHYSGDVQDLNFAGGLIGGSENYTLSSGPGGVTLVAERDAWVAYGGWGPGSGGYMSVSATVSGAYNGVTPTVWSVLAIPERPFYPPDPPDGVDATRSNDSQAIVTLNEMSTPWAPWTSESYEILTVTGTTASPWTPHSTTPGNPEAYAITGLSANHYYAFRVRSNNPSGSSAFAWGSHWVFMTPGAPSNVASSLGGTGTTITTTWTVNSYSAPEVTHTIERSVAGGAWGTVVTGLSWATTSWIDPTPGAGTNQYRVKSVVSAGPLSSAWATGNSVATVVPPLAPTNLAPDGVAVDLEFVGGVLTWTHNPGGDQAAQTHFTIETSINGGSTWQALATDVASSASTYTMAAGARGNGVTVLWKVKTQGGTTAGFGPFSDPATISAEATPAVTLDAAHPADPTIALPLNAWWVYAQDQAVPQTGWEANLYAADGVTLLEHQAGTGATALTAFAYPVADGETYHVAVRAMSGSGMWSAWATAATTIDLPPPAPTTITPTYQPCTGTMSLSISSEQPGAGEVVVEWVVVERRVDGGEWVVLARDVPPDTAMLDLIPLTHGLNEYRATGMSSTPSSRVNAVVQVQGTDGQNLGPGRDGLWVFVNYGPGFATVLRCHADLDIKDAPGRVQSVQPFLGRRKPILLSGIAVSREVAVGATLRYVDPCPNPDTCRFDSPPSDWVTAGQDADVVCYRDFTGRRIFASLDGVQVSDGVWPGNAALGFKVTEVDYTEVTGVLVP